MSEQDVGPLAGAIPTEAELDALFDSLSNWGRFGDEDERGMLNHLMAEHPKSKVIWEFRSFRDVANSALRRFGRDHQLRPYGLQR